MAASGGAESRQDCAAANPGKPGHSWNEAMTLKRMFPPRGRKIADPSFVGHCRARWPGQMNHLEALEADLGAPEAEVGARIIEGVAEFDEHVERHQQTKNVLAAGIVNKRLEGDESAARRQRVISSANQLHLFFQVPVVKDHAHGDDVGLGQGVLEEIAGGGSDTVAEAGGGDVFLRDRLNRQEVEEDAKNVVIFLAPKDREQD